MRVCVVGAGAAGLCAARHLLAEPCVSDVDILEQSSQLGGTWVYTENVGYDDFGLPIHTSMYKSLRTNLPKEIMGFPDFPIPESEKSYIPAKDMLSFLQLYSDKHGITEHIKFKHHVQLIIPKQGATRELWDVTWKDLESGVSTTKEYDYVFVCNGHYNTPFIPNIPGLREFKGDVMHSHDYRVPSIFTNKRVLVVGAGPSGMDIALEITGVTKSVILSHHLKEQVKSVFPDNLVEKPDVVKLDGHTAFFKDGSQEDVDVVFLCTGYLYNFPFLHESCDIVVEDNCVEPLYKHLVNIKHPSMCFIGVPYYVCAFSMFDLQVRFYVRSMNGTFKLPSSEEMIEHWEEEKRDRAARGYTKRQAHMMGPDQAEYYVSLAVESGAEPLPEVLVSIYKVSSQKFLNDLAGFRLDVYTVIDDKTFLSLRVDSAGYYVSLAIESGAEPLPDVFTTVHNHSSQKFLDDIAGFRLDVYTLIDDKNFEKYYASLAVEANTKNLPSVITKIREESSIRFLHNLQNYRQDVYKIIDDDTYEIISNGKREILC